MKRKERQKKKRDVTVRTRIAIVNETEIVTEIVGDAIEVVTGAAAAVIVAENAKETAIVIVTVTAGVAVLRPLKAAPTNETSHHHRWTSIEETIAEIVKMDAEARTEIYADQAEMSQISVVDLGPDHVIAQDVTKKTVTATVPNEMAKRSVIES